MIISASRRTDIPAFYAKWFMKRIKAGYCTMVNPFNRNQLSYASLKPEDVDVIVFWTKNAHPILSNLKELDNMGYRYYFQYTVNGYPSQLEKAVPDLKSTIRTFKKLADQIGPEKVIWRYDPVLLSNITSYKYHKERFGLIANFLRGYTKRVVVSIVDEYRKVLHSFKNLAKLGINIENNINEQMFSDMMFFIAQTARENGLEIYSCAEIIDLKCFNIMPGKCIDNQYIKQIFNVDVTSEKDKSQRLECGCVQSKDIGAYNTCLHGCAYCYAGTLKAAEKNQSNHFLDSQSILGPN